MYVRATASNHPSSINRPAARLRVRVPGRRWTPLHRPSPHPSPVLGQPTRRNRPGLPEGPKHVFPVVPASRQALPAMHADLGAWRRAAAPLARRTLRRETWAARRLP